MAATLNGPDGQTVLGPTSLTIGRVPGNQLVVHDAKASSHHAEIRPDGQGYSIIDLGSTNGTFINEQRLLPNVTRPLRSGDIVRIGDTRFIYKGMDISQLEPTVYASPSLGSSPNYPPSVVPPPPSPNFNYAPPVVPPPPAYAMYGAVEQQGAYAPPVPPTPAQKPSRRGLWITLGAIVGVLLIGAIVFAVIGFVNRSTPTETLNAYCNALKGGDYQTAYNQFLGGIKGETEAQFAAAYSANKVMDCRVSNINDSAGTGVITRTYAQLGTVVYDEQLVNDNGTWKIKQEQPRSTPTFTLNLYCYALKLGDYQTAYGQLSSTAQSQFSSADQFAAVLSALKLTGCTPSNIDDTAGTSKITYTYSSGATVTQGLTLAKENGAWKINGQTRIPTETLNAYCSALKHQDYLVAYGQLSSDVQSKATEAQFAASFGSTKITDCTVSNVDDNAGTGTINYTASDGSTAAFDYTLVNENGIWGINAQKQH